MTRDDDGAPVPAPSARRSPWLDAAALALFVALAYAPSVSSAWLSYDDDWLVRDNPVMCDASAHALRTIAADLSVPARLSLGAEYLPVRDLCVWLEARAFGVEPLPMRAVSVVLYAAACVLLLLWARRVPLVPLLAVWLFALHPAHVESVAWLAGRKDQLALLWTAAALLAYASERASLRRALVPLFVALACFSKATSVVLPLLLLAHDALARRRPDALALALAAVPAALATLVHVRVGASVSMLAALPGGSRSAAVATMAPVFWRYVGLSFGVLPPSLAHAVPNRTFAEPVVLAALAALAALIALAVYAWRRGERRPAVALAWFCVALLPVSQVLAPLQNRMADRYLLVAVFGPCLALAALAEAAVSRARPRLQAALRATLIAACLWLTAPYAALFAEPVALFSDLTAREPASPLGPYQLAMALGARAEHAQAELAFREALRRDALRTSVGRRAANNLSTLLAASGRRDEAIALLRRARAAAPEDPKVLHNLAVLLDERGDRAEARALLEHLVQRFPEYERGRASYRERVGPLP
jgi:tetratricopeptide (TPR) repeat protein